ncbi:3-dehydroquinate synthase, partial [bacterium]|nr:3-dehydroquinate synthase [bacterium]
MQKFILRSLEIKKRIIEQDEFDTGIRNVMNFGHSFGHAIEAATQFGIPHGIAVTIGMDMAGFISVQLDRMAKCHFNRMHQTLRMNYRGFEKTSIPASRFFAAI